MAGPQLSEGERNDILVAIKKGKSVQQVAKEFGRNETTITRLLRDLRPTTELARATLLARANSMVTKVVEKADVDQIMDLLSRPNIGVLEPIQPKGAQGGNNFGLALSVNINSLAAVNEEEFIEAQKQKALEGQIEPDGIGKSVQVGSVKVAELYQDPGK